MTLKDKRKFKKLTIGLLRLKNTTEKVKKII